MKKGKKILSFLLCLLTIMSLFLVSAGCSKDKIIVDEKVINVRVFRGGYGVDWIYELKEKFEATYAEEGYKVNILTPSYDSKGNNVLTELFMGNERTGVDLYFTTDLRVRSVGPDGDYGVVVEDIRETVWNKPAIGFDGKEETLLIKDKAVKGIEPHMSDGDNMYGFNWVQSVGGLVVNTRKLSRYGLTLPRTTNEMLHCFDTIYRGTTYNGNVIENSEKTTTFPITYVSGTSGYTTVMLNTLLAQYEGIANFNEFWSMNANGQKMINDGYEVFNMEGITEMLEVAYRTFDPKIAAYGSQTQGVDQAQAKIMKDGHDAIFMCNGDWMLNEVKLNYRNNLHDIEFINFPVISTLGIKLFGSGTRLNLNDADCDALLSYIVGLVDENKTIEQIISAVSQNKSITITADEAERVAEARGLYFSRGVEMVAYIAKDANAKEPAELLLRMFASNDFSKIFAQTTNGTSPYAYDIEIDTPFKFVQQASNIAQNRYVQIITSGVSGLRREMSLGTMFPQIPHIPTAIVGNGISMYDGKGGILPNITESIYRNAAEIMQQSEYNNAKNRWNTWKTNAGY